MALLKKIADLDLGNPQHMGPSRSQGDTVVFQGIYNNLHISKPLVLAPRSSETSSRQRQTRGPPG